MKRLHLFSWMKPAVEDLHYERDAKELHIKKRIIDLTGGGTGILKDVLNELEIYVADPLQFLVVKVKTGEAYIEGEKIEITNEQTVNLDDVQSEANIVWLRYKLDDSCDSDAIRNHPITGVPHIVWKVDSFELGATKESQYVVSDDKMKLARVAKVGNELKVTHDYREWLKIAGDVMANYVNESDFYVGGPEGIGTKLLKQQAAPPVPTRLDLTTGWDDVFRKTGASAGLVSFRPAYIKAEFGDNGNGTASGNTFTKTDNRVGDWTTDEWQDQYLTCADGNSWKVVSNTTDTLTLEAEASPVSGAFWLGPNARGYKFVIQTLDPSTEEIVAVAETEAQATESPVKMEFIFHNLTPDVKYRIKIASRGGWYQEEWSAFCTPEAIIAGGVKEIPDSCADVLDGEPTISAEDDGIRVNWSVKSEYADKIAGFEICWTDDGTTTPDFNNKNHRKIFTDRDFIVLAARMSSEDTDVKVKAKMRAVDKAGRHCVTPKTLNDTNTKKYPADLLTIVTDHKNILEPGGFSSLKDFLSKSINLEDGRGKTISEVESEIADGRKTYPTIGKRMDALAAAGVDWGYVRIVAKSGGFVTVQDALNSIESSDFHLILIMPGDYTEDIVIPDNRLVGFLGTAETRIIGSIKSNSALARCCYLGDLKICTDQQDKYPLDIWIRGVATRKNTLFEKIWIAQDNATSGNAIRLQYEATGPGIKLVLDDFHVRAKGGKGIILKSSVSTTIQTYVNTCEFETYNACIDTDGPACAYKFWLWNTTLKAGAGTTYSIIKTNATGVNLYMAQCRYNKLPDEANITIDYGIIDVGKISNVRYDDADLEIVLGS